LNPHSIGAWSASVALSVWPVRWLVMEKVAELSEAAVTFVVMLSPGWIEKSAR
jgi:hypothetical protein